MPPDLGRPGRPRALYLHDPLRRYTGRQVWNRQTAMSSWTELPGPRTRFMITIGAQKEALTCTLSEPPIGIEPMTYALRGCSRALLAGLKARASFMFASCCWWRSLAVDGCSGASRGHARNA